MSITKRFSLPTVDSRSIRMQSLRAIARNSTILGQWVPCALPVLIILRDILVTRSTWAMGPCLTLTPNTIAHCLNRLTSCPRTIQVFDLSPVCPTTVSTVTCRPIDIRLATATIPTILQVLNWEISFVSIICLLQCIYFGQSFNVPFNCPLVRLVAWKQTNCFSGELPHVFVEQSL